MTQKGSMKMKETISKTFVQVDIEKIRELRKIVEDGLLTKIELPFDLKLEEILKKAYTSRGDILNHIQSFIDCHFSSGLEKKDLSKTYLDIDREKIVELGYIVRKSLNATEVGLPMYSISIKLENVLRSGYDERGKVLSAINEWIRDNCSGAF